VHGKNPSRFFSDQEKQAIQGAIARAERNTSGEIRVHLVPSFPKGADPLELGKNVFEKLRMTATAERNGILFLLELKGHHLVVLGDRGIHEKVHGEFWQEIRDVVLEKFQQGDFSGGLIKGVERCGEKLKNYFPYRAGDINELSDDLSEH
jgi:uncharacterized membrane protein